MKKSKILKLTSLFIMMFVLVASAYATKITVTVYGKGGASGGTGGGGTVTVCPQSSSDVCAKIEVDVPAKSIGHGEDNILINSNVIIHSIQDGKRFNATIISADIMSIDYEKGTGVFSNVIVR